MTMTTCIRCGAQYLNMPYALCIPCWRETGVKGAIAEDRDESVAGFRELVSEVVYGRQPKPRRVWVIGGVVK